MGNKAAQMTMAATVWLSANRPDMTPRIALHLASMMGEVAEAENWMPPAADYDANAPKSNEDIQAFLDSSDALRASTMHATGYPEELAALISSVANFMGWKVSA